MTEGSLDLLKRFYMLWDPLKPADFISFNKWVREAYLCIEHAVCKTQRGY
jgi:hypothetical protein